MASLIDDNVIWLIRSNIVRFEHILSGELTADQRQAMERLLAEQRAKLDGLGQSETGD